MWGDSADIQVARRKLKQAEEKTLKDFTAADARTIAQSGDAINARVLTLMNVIRIMSENYKFAYDFVEDNATHEAVMKGLEAKGFRVSIRRKLVSSVHIDVAW
jgi:hypothetical protein